MMATRLGDWGLGDSVVKGRHGVGGDVVGGGLWEHWWGRKRHTRFMSEVVSSPVEWSAVGGGVQGWVVWNWVAG